MRAPRNSDSNVATNRRLISNGRELENDEAMPANVRRLCHDIMSVIENNGEVTLPSSAASGQFVTKRKSLLFAVIGVMLGAGVFLVFHYSR
jgi:hypothetical protein